MIDYEIIKLDPINSQVQIKYSKENKPNFFYRCFVSGFFNEENIHNEAVKNSEWAIDFWNKQNEIESFELSVSTGQAKNIEHDDEIEYDATNQKVEHYTEEDSSTIYYKKRVVDLSDSEKALQIRNKRNVLLQETDSEMLSDRTPSEEIIAYRQALRDIPSQEGFPNDITWPMKPID